jgi:hypothetical protein
MFECKIVEKEKLYECVGSWLRNFSLHPGKSLTRRASRRDAPTNTATQGCLQEPGKIWVPENAKGRRGVPKCKAGEIGALGGVGQRRRGRGEEKREGGR